MDRREFVSTIGAAGAAAFLPWEPTAASDRINKIGLQLYTVRGMMQTSAERTLAQVAAIGYKEVEFKGYNRPPRALRQLLDRNGLSSPSAQVGMDLVRGPWNRTLNDAAEIGHKWLVIGDLPESDRNSVDAIKRTAEVIRKAANDAKLYKIKLAYHNHEVEFGTIEGRRMFDVLLEETKPENLQVEMDLYWITKGGGDPLAYFAKWPERFPLVHLKDAGPPPDRAMLDVGKGTIKWASLFAKRKEAGIKHFYVEHDNPADPLASIKASFAYLRELRF